MSHIGGIMMERCVSHAWHSYSAGIFKNSTQSLMSRVKGTFTAPQAIVYYTNPTLHNANGCTFFVFFGANSMHTSGSAAERPWGAQHW